MNNQIKNRYQHLKGKWTKKHRELSENLWKKHANSLKWLSDNSKQLAVGSLGGLLLLASPVQGSSSLPTPTNEEIVREMDKSAFLISELSDVLPKQFRFLTDSEEKTVSGILSRRFNLTVVPELEGKRLNTTYGIIGAEQHLARFPGDTMAIHFDGDSEEAKKYWSSGMAPGLSAYGYFAPSSNEFSTEDKLREKYYIAVQTFLAPGFSQNVKDYNDFFKFRKMLVVNAENGRAVVADIGDAGPGESTGKHLGGSPEVMDYLQRFDGAQRGPVLFFFIDDPKDQVPLGPIDVVQ